jgi:stage II sporulation protein D
MQQAGYPQYGAHVDDTTSYQVYNNIREQESTTTAVKETYGQLLYTNADALAETFYYSTSCGVGSDANVWKTAEAASIDYITAKNISNNGGQIPSLADNEEFSGFIAGKDTNHFEAEEGWYRWTYHVPEIDVERICSVMQQRYNTNSKLVLTLCGEKYVEQPVETFSSIQDMYISRRGAGGIADEMIIVADNTTYKVISEHNIRYVLNDGVTKVWRQDGSKVAAPTLLPSAFFALSVAKEKETVVGFTLAGGGFGHGVGMSQNAAKGMAKQGYMAEDILLFFYDNCVIKNVYQ